MGDCALEPLTASELCGPTGKGNHHHLSCPKVVRPPVALPTSAPYSRLMGPEKKDLVFVGC